MRGMLGLSMTPIASAVRLSGAAISQIESRAIPDLDGSQSALLSEQVVLMGHDGFTVETEICTTATETVSIFSFYSDEVNEHFGVRINHSGAQDKLKIYSAGYTPNEGSIVVNDGKIHTVKLEYLASENRFSLYVDDVLDYTVVAGPGFSLADSYNVLICARKDTTIYPIDDLLPGLCFRFNIWTQSGGIESLIRDLKFDKVDTDYQPDYTLPPSVEINTNSSDDYSAAGGLPSISIDGDFITGTSAPDGGFERIATYINDSFEVGKKYLLSAEVYSSDTSSLYIQGQNSSGRVAETGKSGTYNVELLWEATDVSCLIALESSNKPNNTLRLNYKTLSVSEWSGAILQNVVHGSGGNWLLIERKKAFNYWLSYNEVDTAELSRLGTGVDCDVFLENGNLRIVSHTTDASWIGANFSNLADGHLYQVSFTADEFTAGSGLAVMDGSDTDIVSGFQSIDVVSGIPSSGRISFRDRNGHTAGDEYYLNNISIRRKLEYAS